ncbi:MAG: hypothetical protein FWE01_01045 [Firmicutes bacterium]|nr:hypothetical protein [Bacillota bacterium]
MKISVTKSISLFVVGAILAVSGILAVILSPFHNNFTARANWWGVGNPAPHTVLSSHSVTNLSRENVTVGETIVYPRVNDGSALATRPRANFVLVFTTGVPTIIATSSNSTFIPANLRWDNRPLTWNYAGDFEFRLFADESDFITELGSASIANISTSGFFHNHPVSVESNVLTFNVPQNSAVFEYNGGIRGNIITPEIIPDVSIEHMPFTLPLPSTFTDRRGNNLFQINRDLELNRYVVNLAEFETLYRDFMQREHVNNTTGARTTFTGANPYPTPSGYTSFYDYYNALNNEFRQLDFLRNLVFYHTTLILNGNPAAIYMNEYVSGNWEPTLNANSSTLADINVTATAGVVSIEFDTCHQRRTFIPVVAGNFDGEYRFVHPDGVSSASFRTSTIVVENIRMTQLGAEGPDRVMGRYGNPRNEQIRFDLPPQIDGVAPSLSINTQTSLAPVLMPLSRIAQGTGNNPDIGWNPVRFATAEQLRTFSFVRIEFFPRRVTTGAGDDALGTASPSDENPGWRLARTPEFANVNLASFPGGIAAWNSANNETRDNWLVANHPDAVYHMVTDLNFIPTEFGEYRFTYFTTTLLGAGYDHHSHNRWVYTQQGVQAPALYQGLTFARFRPFERIWLHQHDAEPQIRWTSDFAYNADGRAVEGQYELVGTENVWTPTTNRINFEDAEDLSRHLPGRNRNDLEFVRGTQILAPAQGASSAVLDRGDHILTIPAILGHDNHSVSRDLIYTISITRILESDPTTRHRMVFATDVTPSRQPTTPGDPEADREYQPFDNTRALELDFYNRTFRNGDIFGPLHTLFNGVNGQREARYNVTITVRQRPEAGRVSRPMEEFFTFVVVPSSQFEMNETRPEIRGGLHIPTRMLYEGDTLEFNPIAPSDIFTDAGNIETEYFFMFQRQIAVAPFTETVVVPANDYLDITVGQVSLELNRTNNLASGASIPLATQLLDAINPSTGVLQVTVLAVARNFFAITRNHQFQYRYEISAGNYVYILDPAFPTHPAIGSAAPHTQLAGVEFVHANFFIYSIEYGRGANIMDGFGFQWMHDGTQAENNERWSTQVGAANQYERILIPTFAFNYTSAATSGTAINFQIRQPVSRTSVTPSVYGSPWGGFVGSVPVGTPITNISSPDVYMGDVANRIDNSSSHRVMSPRYDNSLISGSNTLGVIPFESGRILYFEPSEVGEHRLTVTVHNPGGNISVFMATIRVIGDANVNTTLEGGVTSMRMGQSRSLPIPRVSIQGTILETRGFFFYYQNTRVGEYHIDFWSDNGQIARWSGLNFNPPVADHFHFRFTVELRGDILGGHVDRPAPYGGLANRFNFPVADGIIRDVPMTHPIVVTGLLEGDLEIHFSDTLYRQTMDNQGGLHHAALTTAMRDMRNANDTAYLYPWLRPGFTSPDFNGGVANPNPARNIGSHNFIRGLASTQTPTGTTTLDVPMMQTHALNNMIPRYDLGADVYEFGFIFLPEFFASLRDGLSIPYNFHDNAETSVTVRGPRSETNTYLLNNDTNGNGPIRFVQHGTRRIYYFQPQGRVFNEGDATNPAFTPWGDETLYMDGTYTITFNVSFGTTSATKTFNVRMGDNAVPVISMREDIYNDLFNQIWRVDEIFRLNSLHLYVDNSGGITEFTPFRIATELNLDVVRPDTTPVREGNDFANGDMRLVVDTDDTAIRNAGNDTSAYRWGNQNNLDPDDRGRQQWEFLLNQAGTDNNSWQIEISIESRSGVRATLFRTITVEDTTPRATTSPAEVWSWILIALASAVALGIVYYFIKTGRQTKFASAQAKQKNETISSEKPDQV